MTLQLRYSLKLKHHLSNSKMKVKVIPPLISLILTHVMAVLARIRGIYSNTQTAQDLYSENREPAPQAPQLEFILKNIAKMSTKTLLKRLKIFQIELFRYQDCMN